MVYNEIMTELICPQCKNKMKKNGLRSGKQRYRCVSCGYNFTSDKIQTLKQRSFNSNLKTFIMSCINNKDFEKQIRTSKIENIKIESVDNLAPLLELKKNALVMFQCGNTIKYISLSDFMSQIENEKAVNITHKAEIEKLEYLPKAKKKHLSIDDFDNIDYKDAISLLEQTDRDFEE